MNHNSIKIPILLIKNILCSASYFIDLKINPYLYSVEQLIIHVIFILLFNFFPFPPA